MTESDPTWTSAVSRSVHWHDITDTTSHWTSNWDTKCRLLVRKIRMGLPARLDLVLRFGLEIAGVMALAQLFFRRTAGAVDHSPALDGRALADFFRPARQVFVFVRLDRKSTRLNSSHLGISYAVFCLKKKRLNYPAVLNSQRPGAGDSFAIGIALAGAARGRGQPASRRTLATAYPMPAGVIATADYYW